MRAPLAEHLPADAPELFLPAPRGPQDAAPAALRDHDVVLHVANRLAHGPTPALIADIRAQSAAGWIEAQLDPASIDDTGVDLELAGFLSLRLAPGDARDLGLTPAQIRREVRVAALLRAAHSERQLLEVMVEFWRNHFSIDMAGHWESLAGAHYEHTAIRPFAMGRFGDLLSSVAHAPSMLQYLNNASSRAPEVNENFAREVLELHTVGVSGGYGEDDVRMAAYAFSGWGFDADKVAFVFREKRHDTRALQVMDWHAPAGTGVQRGQSLLDHLAMHPATATHLASKLAKWFIGEDVSTGLVMRAAKAYLTNDTNIVALLRVLLLSEEFLGSTGQKMRQPFSQLAAWLRATDATADTTSGAEATGTVQLERLLADLGQPVWGWPTPDGCPDDGSHWAGSALVMARWRHASRLMANRIAGIQVDHSRLSGSASTVGELVDHLGAQLLSRALDDDARATLVSFGGGAHVPLSEVEQHRVEQLSALVLMLPAALRR